MAATKYVKHLFKVTDRFIIYLILIHPELEIGVADGSEWNFDQSLLQFNAKKKIYAKNSSRFEFKCCILSITTLNS